MSIKVESIVYDFITVRDGRDEVLTELRSQAATIAELTAALRLVATHHHEAAHRELSFEGCDWAICQHARAALAKVTK